MVVREEEAVVLIKVDVEAEVEGVKLVVAIRLPLILKDDRSLLVCVVVGDARVDTDAIEDTLPTALVLLLGVPDKDALLFIDSVPTDVNVIESVVYALELAMTEGDKTRLKVG